eukprot:TRINITY_DN11482_c0_g1_i14.p4 TRINITY_DN11482_c0_g1~~TRINITY_DN11482_c0_g1_i14.p4  ORF type:complete len:107 (+),score=1.77 TRINITY_DN11482_c0_g1_i14:177-497(+)
MSGAVSGRQLCRDLIRHINSNDDAELLSSDVKFFLSFISTSDEEVHEELIIDEVLPAVHRSLARALHARSYEIVVRNITAAGHIQINIIHCTEISGYGTLEPMFVA